MDWEKNIAEFDKSQTISILEAFPKNCLSGYWMGRKAEIVKPGQVSSIFASGMGSSGYIGMMLREAFKKSLQIPIIANTGYELPGFVGQKTLFLAVSYSGNTEETIEVLEKSWERRPFTVACCSGGKLSDLAEQKILVPANIPPRMSLPFLFFAVIGGLEKMGIIKSMEKEVKATAEMLEREKKSIIWETRKLALEMKDCFPVIYSPEGLECLSLRFQTDINENSKMLAHPNTIPEMNHNEINATIMPGKTFMLFLRTKNETEKMRKRAEFTKKTFSQMCCRCEQVQIKGNNPVEQLSFGVMFSLFLSFNLAMANKKDPEAIPTITELKKELAE